MKYIVLIIQNTSGFSRWDKMLWAWQRKTAHIHTPGLSLSSVLAAHKLNTAKSMMPAHPLSLTKQQSQSIVPDPSVTNSYIHIDTPGNKTPKERGIEGWTETWRDIFLLLFLFRWGISNQSPPFSLYSCKLLCHLFSQQSVLPKPPMMYHYHNFGWKSIESIGLSWKLAHGIAYTLWGLFIH